LENIEQPTFNPEHPMKRMFGFLFGRGFGALDVSPIGRKSNKSLPNLSIGQGQMGDGSSPVSLSRADIWRALFRGCQLPDAILHGKRNFRPRSRAVQRLADMHSLFTKSHL
jgi:hypothetical protein